MGTKIEQVIMNRNINKCIILAREYYEHKPNIMPIKPKKVESIIKETAMIVK